MNGGGPLCHESPAPRRNAHLQSPRANAPKHRSSGIRPLPPVTDTKVERAKERAKEMAKERVKERAKEREDPEKARDTIAGDMHRGASGKAVPPTQIDGSKTVPRISPVLGQDGGLSPIPGGVVARRLPPTFGPPDGGSSRSQAIPVRRSMEGVLTVPGSSPSGGDMDPVVRWGPEFIRFWYQKLREASRSTLRRRSFVPGGQEGHIPDIRRPSPLCVLTVSGGQEGRRTPPLLEPQTFERFHTSQALQNVRSFTIPKC
jgi:hypothetical protein